MARSQKKFDMDFPLNIDNLKNYLNTEENKENLFKYTDLCEILNQPIKKHGSGRTNQLDYWANFMDFSLVGKKYCINEIYPFPLISFFDCSSIDFYNTSIYIILALLLDEQSNFKLNNNLEYFSDSSDVNTILISKNVLAQKLGFINSKFKLYSFNYKKLLDNKKFIEKYPNNPNLDETFIKGFYLRIFQSYSNYIERILSHMEKRQLIFCDSVTCGYVMEDKEYKILNGEQLSNILKIAQETFDDIADNNHIVYYKKLEQPIVDEGWGLPNPMNKDKKTKVEIIPSSLQDFFKYNLSDAFFISKADRIREKLKISHVGKAFKITINNLEYIKNSFADKINTSDMFNDFIANNLYFADKKQQDYINSLTKQIDKETDIIKKHSLQEQLPFKIKSNSDLIDFLVKIDDFSFEDFKNTINN